jgi:hypothetical protein
MFRIPMKKPPAKNSCSGVRVSSGAISLRAGFQIHLAKPIDATELVAAVAALAKRLSAQG